MNKNYIHTFCREFDYPEEAEAEFYKAAEYVEKDEKLNAMFEKYLNSYFSDFSLDTYTGYDQISQYGRTLTDMHYETLDLLYFILLAEHLEVLYERNNLPREIFHDSMNDLKCKLFECYNCKGIWGSFVAFWFPGFYSLYRYGIGRLQYEPGFEIQDEKTLDGQNIKGEFFINMHIPSSGKLIKSEVEDSLNRAAKFFGEKYRDRFEGKDYVMFGCFSWLLFDKHQDMLPETSGIVQFQKLFSYVSKSEVNEEDDLWRIFNTLDTADYTKLPENTLLQRKYKEFLLSGGKQGSGFGVIKVKKQ